MMSAAAAATTDGPDLEQAALPDDSVAPEWPTTPAPKQNRKRTAAIAASILVCVGVIVGVLAATPWKSDDASQQQQPAAGGGTAPWPHSTSDLAPDAGVAYGTLDNGLRYMVMHNSEPPNQVMLRMHVDAGSYHEDDDQQGLAASSHFLEHMAFNGLRSYPDAEDLIPEMQRLGIAFGAHANAFTYFDETGYELDLPNATDEKALDIAFTVMRDYADGMLLEEEEIEKERGVILSELTFRDSVDYRLTKKLWSFLLPSHRLPLRWPGGDPDVISTVPRQRFVDFYGDHYTPDRITVIACGDMDPKEMEKRITEAYESMAKRKGDDMGGIDLGTVATGSGFETAVFSDEELVNEELFLTFARPYDMPADTEAGRIAQYPLAFAHNILSRRLSLAAKRDGSPFRSGSASGGGRAGILGRSGIEMGSLSLTLASDNDDSWKESIAILEQEFRRALLYGFAPHELAEVVANYQSFYETQVDVAPTRQSKRLAGELLSTIKDEQVFTTPTEDLRIFSKAVETLEIDDIHAAFKSFWDTSDLKLVLYAKEANPDATDVMEQLYNESKETEVDPPDMDVQTTFLYSEFGEPGEVVSDTTQEDLEIRQLRLSNNVRVNLKKTDFQASSIGLTARFGTGMLSQDGSKPGVQYFASQVMNGGGLGKHSNDDLSRILAGKNVGVSFSVGEGSFALSGGTTPEDLKLQLQLMAAQIVDPGWRSETLQYWQQSAASYDTMFKSKIDGAQYHVEEYLKNDDRFAVPSLEEMNALTIADVQEWLQPQLANSFLELSIVGAFDMENTISLILETFGALPEREESPPAIDDELRALQFPDSPAERTFTYESKLPAASSVVAWKVPHIEEDISQSRKLSLLSSMLRDRLRVQIREDIGESYSPRASTDISDNFNFGIIRADSPGESDAVEAVGIQIVDIASKMAADMDEDELFRAREPILTNLQKQKRSNSYWLSVMSSSQAKPHKLDWARLLESDFASVTLEDLQDLAVAYLTPDNALRMEIIPVNPSDAAV